MLTPHGTLRHRRNCEANDTGVTTGLTFRPRFDILAIALEVWAGPPETTVSGRAFCMYRVCSTPGCPTLHEDTGRCTTCAAKADKARRPDGNPYRTRGHLRFRELVLARNPRCVCPGDCGRHTSVCGGLATVADHWPTERRDLVSAGLDPDDPARGRGLCVACHNGRTARSTPGGWNDTKP